MIFLITGGSGRDLRVSAYLIADNAAMIENMDTSRMR